MNSEYIRNIRYKLQKRFVRLMDVDYRTYHNTLKQFLEFLNRYPIITGTLTDLAIRCPSVSNAAQEIVERKKVTQGDTEIENAALSYFVIKKCAESNDNMIEVNIGLKCSRGLSNSESLEYFNKLFIEPLYEYLDEQIDDQGAILALLRRYKHKCEWFNREYLYDLWNKNTKLGEKKLAFHLYEYLYDTGLDFAIEPLSAAGEADLVAAQQSDEPLIADAKIFHPEGGRGKDYIVKGFNQIYQYTVSYNEPVGYLIIFKVCEEDLKLTLKDETQATPIVIHNNKTIFLMTIDIFPYKTSASRRGRLKVIEITGKDLIQKINSQRT